MSSATLVRNARRKAGITQRELASRVGMTQPEIARLERPGANPTLSTLDLVMSATGHRLEARPVRGRVPPDNAQIMERVALTPAERLEAFERSHRALGELVGKARRVSR